MSNYHGFNIFLEEIAQYVKMIALMCFSKKTVITSDGASDEYSEAQV
jgi:hypothetical protein